MSHSGLLRLLSATTASLFLAMAIQAAPFEPPIPAIHFTFSESSFRAILAQWKSEGIERLNQHFVIDFLFLISYGTFGYVYARQTGLSSRAKIFIASSFPWMLPVAALLDAAENVLHLYFIRSLDAAPQVLYPIAGVVATSKWLLIATFAVIAIYGKVAMRASA